MKKIRGAVLRAVLLVGLVAILVSGCLGDNDLYRRLNVYVHNATGETLYVNGEGIGGNLLYIGPLTGRTGPISIQIAQPAHVLRVGISLSAGTLMGLVGEGNDQDRGVEFVVWRSSTGEYSVTFNQGVQPEWANVTIVYY